MDANNGLRRRHYLVTLGSAIATAGCSGEGGSGGGSTAATSSPTESNRRGTDQQRATDTPEPTETPVSGEASFEIVEYAFPGEIEAGKWFTPSITVRNTGGAPGTLEESLYYRVGNSDWVESGTWIFEDVAPGEELTVNANDDWAFSIVAELEFALGEREKTVTMETVPADLAFGESFLNIDDVKVTVSTVDLKGAYEYTDYNGDQTRKEAPDGSQWGFVQIRAENTGDEAAFTPLATDISIIAGNQQYDSTYVDKEESAYEGNEVQPGIVREGFIAYELPDNLSLGDLTVVWNSSGVYGDTVVRWSSSA
jgi:hypothetical protein